ncbi:GtrA family protein [Sphingomonas pruni]|uniref:GtrA family protein n=1 Tax=Sphingomonas pruni TaxID=40683 RepID=UPI000AB3D6C4|nr:GtrA family protein [Sphingomonas pruni]
MMNRVMALLWRATYLRYLAASVLALAVDFSLFLALRATGMPIALLSALSYSAGILVHWLISSRLVFAGELRDIGIDRARQQALFLLSAFAGLLITVAIVSLAVQFGIDARLAKLVAVAASFQATYLLRAKIVFA